MAGIEYDDGNEPVEVSDDEVVRLAREGVGPSSIAVRLAIPRRRVVEVLAARAPEVRRARAVVQAPDQRLRHPGAAARAHAERGFWRPS